MKLLIGLGNPGEKYARNRHNVGFMFTDFFLNKYIATEMLPPVQFKFDKYVNADVATIKNGSTSILIAKPQTFMNRSGETVRKLMINDKKLTATNLFVAHDELDIPIGKFKIQQATGPKLHNGLESIEECIGTEEFFRIRIGVENRPSENRMPGEAFVLQNFTEDEKKIIEETFASIYDRIIQEFLAI